MYGETIAGVTVGRAYRTHYALTEYSPKDCASLRCVNKISSGYASTRGYSVFHSLESDVLPLIFACFCLLERYSVLYPLMLEQN
jgi:hypothetical protein